MLPEYTQRPTSDHSASSETARCIWTQGARASGSAQGIAYSEFNHRVVGLFLLLIGLSELGHTVRFDSPVWTCLFLPSALGVVVVFLLVWSDHEAWPIGALSFTQTFFLQYHEILQHKF